MLDWILQLEFPHIRPYLPIYRGASNREQRCCLPLHFSFRTPDIQSSQTHTHTHSFSRIGNCMQAQGSRNPWPKTGSWEEPCVQSRCWPDHETTCSLLLQNARLLHWKQWFSTGAAPYTPLGSFANYGCLWVAVQSNTVRGSQRALGAHISPEFPGDFCYFYFLRCFLFLCYGSFLKSLLNLLQYCFCGMFCFFAL